MKINNKATNAIGETYSVCGFVVSAGLQLRLETARAIYLSAGELKLEQHTTVYLSAGEVVRYGILLVGDVGDPII